MRRYTVNVNGTDHVIDVEEVTANTFRVELDGIAADVRLTDHQAMNQAMIAPGMEVSQSTRTAAPVQVSRPAAATSAPRPAAQAAPPAAAPVAGGAGDLTAPMPGVVLSIAVEPGNAVKRGDTLLVLEAMKMKNELKAKADGTVKAVHATVGQQVGFGDALVSFEG